MDDKFQNCTVDVQAGTVIFNHPRVNLVFHYPPYDVSNIYGWFQRRTVNVLTHALNSNNQYLILLQVYKAASWTSKQ